MSNKHFDPIYRFGRCVGKNLFDICFQAEAYGEQWVPKSGPFLVATNHVSFFDPFLAGGFVNQELFFFARKTLYDNPLSGWFLHHFNAIPVDRDGASDITAFKRVLKVLKNGDGLLIFPEGTRSRDGTIGSAKRGIGMMACKVQVPVIPARIFGAHEAWKPGKKLPTLGSKLTIVFGKPIYPETYDLGKTNPSRFQIASDTFLEAIKALEIPVSA